MGLRDQDLTRLVFFSDADLFVRLNSGSFGLQSLFCFDFGGASSEQYKSALEKAGFEITAERNRRDFAIEFFADLAAKTHAAGGPPPLGIHLLMGESRAVKVKNMADNIQARRIAPVEIIARLI